MKLHYYLETDSLYIELSGRAGAKSHEVTDSVVVDLDADGNVVGIDVQHASKSLDLETLETVALPLSATRSGERSPPSLLPSACDTNAETVGCRITGIRSYLAVHVARIATTKTRRKD